MNQPEQWSMNFIQKFLIDNSEKLIFLIVQLGITVILFMVIKFFIDRLFDTTVKNRLRSTAPQRVSTITTVLRNAINYLLYFFLFYALLSILGFPMGTLVASAGIAGVAFGMGAKEFVTDVINGAFIIFEGHFDIGEVIELPAQQIIGTIQQLGIRSTTIKGFNGSLYYIPNRELKIVNNLSRNDRNVYIDIPLQSSENLAEIEAIIQRETLVIQQQYAEFITGEPVILGLIANHYRSFDYRIIFSIKNSDYTRLASQFYSHYFKALPPLEFKKQRDIY
ncbi:mechanosensitive ion channel family protein [Tuanshanicoccus lijuaniae]|uniref:mechanosensitive ion channel family protein n=1 Tax=Aerococcaceae bacterium zg-1292 TaxID=2774330 RepID=UPI001937DC42|nr:mechanosensitive ion channel family protein [Aerococcaceae bacterium zg-1292]MBF6626780.1 mechanosensitive ion channel family protein [Aerococcaceae bacterium zg-BR9]MBF6978719.1 mechanosensitive ion channel family protein [Aerococcaceae bacterium zg-BR22]QQA36651.1 mechanosensitive ion channel family protein [Aerococcaceae bacterium zg-1292]